LELGGIDYHTCIIGFPKRKKKKMGIKKKNVEI
jgi:hypothetical protein